MSWGSFDYKGQVRDLTHLDPFTINVTPKAPGAPTWTVRVSFSHHTFTRELQPGDGPQDEYAVGSDVRCFCTDRYPLSLSLPGIIQANANGRAYFTQGHNLMFVENIPGLQQGPYAIFFNMERARKLKGIDATMFVVSAYEKPGLPPMRSLRAITMPTLVAKTLGQQPITNTRAKRRWKGK
ncbi:MAG TPA: hypothetical protein VGU01_01635 [Sphingomicrobium sp.]|nr:hypothetical protein [Sphingomicrobium sp.]